MSAISSSIRCHSLLFPSYVQKSNCIVLHNYFPWYITHHPPHDTNAPTQGHRHVHWQAQTDTQNNSDFTQIITHCQHVTRPILRWSKGDCIHNTLRCCYWWSFTTNNTYNNHIYIFMMLLLVVIYDQQHLQQHLYIYDVVVGCHLRPTTPTTTTTFRYLWCCCWWSFTTNNTYNNNIYHPAENVSTQVLTPYNEYLLHTTSIYSIRKVLTLCNK